MQGDKAVTAVEDAISSHILHVQCATEFEVWRSEGTYCGPQTHLGPYQWCLTHVASGPCFWRGGSWCQRTVRFNIKINVSSLEKQEDWTTMGLLPAWRPSSCVPVSLSPACTHYPSKHSLPSGFSQHGAQPGPFSRSGWCNWQEHEVKSHWTQSFEQSSLL